MADTLVRFDWAIKRLLRNKVNFVILEGFLSELLKEDVLIQEVLESETNRLSPEDKQNRVDILVKNSKEELIIIEVQQNHESDYFHRMVYAASKLVTEQMYSGYKYGEIKHVISINILYFDLGQGKDYIYKGQTQFTGLHSGGLLQLSEAQKKIYFKEQAYQIFPEYYIIKVNNFNDVAKDSLDEWIYFLKNSDIKDGFKAKGILDAKEGLKLLKLTKEERMEYEGFLNVRRIRENEIETAQYLGIEIGGKQTKNAIASKMIANGYANKEIVELTGLSVEEMIKLRAFKLD
ncbi:Rpn family recombination-promoting nuclease/putative transposase [Parasediminibacterium sp. JCM 36343]|uniref:Rpn family recombination-promoting nuclease/putative transposase n=1 Tax=Parasediminibacterium sp. JCM 36343 TaxID=3374279 RepID=UPI00397B5955